MIDKLFEQYVFNIKEVDTMAKGVPRRDGSGGGTRDNRGRGGCSKTRSTGRGRNRR